MICAVCRREARGFGFSPSLIRRSGPMLQLCSRRCQDIAVRCKGMINPSENEQTALLAAGKTGGAYIERLGKTDIATWSALEWTSFIDAVVSAYHEHLASAESDDLLW